MIEGQDEEGNKEQVFLYRCCDFFEDVMKELIQKAFKGWHSITEAQYTQSQCTPQMIRAVIFAEAYIELKAEDSWHVYISPWNVLDSSADMILDVTDAHKWILTYFDWNEQDKDIEVKEELTKNGWKLLSSKKV